MIGRPPYLYFLLFRTSHPLDTGDFCTVHIGTPSIGRLPYLYFLLLFTSDPMLPADWKTAVLLLPFTSLNRTNLFWLEDCRIYTSFYSRAAERPTQLIGRLPYLYFLLLMGWTASESRRLEDCRITTSFYWKLSNIRDWKTAVFILPSTRHQMTKRETWLEDCRIYTSFYC